MTKEDLAALLHGTSYPFDLPHSLASPAREAGLVVVYGASDDLMEFRGAIIDELGACDGSTVLVTRDGLFNDEACLDSCQYFLEAKTLAQQRGRTLEACWEREEYTWTYKTDIPHVTFDILENGEKYCRGIIFALSEVERHNT